MVVWWQVEISWLRLAADEDCTPRLVESFEMDAEMEEEEEAEATSRAEDKENKGMPPSQQQQPEQLQQQNVGYHLGMKLLGQLDPKSWPTR